jgi:hypothetical protein
VSDVDDGGVVLNVNGGSVQELDYVEVRTTEQRDKHTRGEVEMTGTLQSMPMSEWEVQGLYKVCTGKGCMRDVAEALQSIQQRPSDTRSQSYRLLAKLSSLIY